jgi:hypothetical protein
MLQWWTRQAHSIKAISFQRIRICAAVISPAGRASR